MRYNETQKAAALKLADEIGAKKASEQLSIAYPTILDWKKKRAESTTPTELAEESPSVTPTVAVPCVEDPSLEMQVRLLQQENALLKTQLARQAKAIHALSPIDGYDE